MKKYSRKANAGEKRLLNKLGMTYVELLCALSLLSLIIVMFTPMLLSSYETLYTAGEKVESVYDSKTELEEGLAIRFSKINLPNDGIDIVMKYNATQLFETLRVNGKKIVSSFQRNFETMYSGGRARIDIISPTLVPDDQPYHDIILQTTGLSYTTINFGGQLTEAQHEDLDPKTIHIAAVLPNKQMGDGTTTTEETAYDYYGISATILDENNAVIKQISSNGLVEDDIIKFRVSAKNTTVGELDFSTSPIRITVYYKNTRGICKTTSDYLYISPPTLMFAGASSQYDYYTSAGVKEEDISGDATNEEDRKTQITLDAFERSMRTSNSGHLKNGGYVTPKNNAVDIRSIRWIDNDETTGIKPYYIMTGTNGYIYRMYNFAGAGTTFYTNANVLDESFSIDSDGTMVYPSVWSGDFAHVFDFSTGSAKRTAYGPSVNHSDGDECWVTSVNKDGVVGDPDYNIFDLRARYSYYFNGDATKFDYQYAKSRPISYILTETGYSLRMYGFLGEWSKHPYVGLYDLWDRANIVESDENNTFYNDPSKVLAFHYPNNHSDLNHEQTFAGIRFKVGGSYNVTKINLNDGDVDKRANYFEGNSDSDHEFENPSSARKASDLNKDYLSGQDHEINITDGVYIPAVYGSNGKKLTDGTTFYVGNIHAYMHIRQSDKTDYTYAFANKDPKASNPEGKHYYNRQDTYWKDGWLLQANANLCAYPVGKTTEYIVLSNHDGTSTYVGRYSMNNDWEEFGTVGLMEGFSNISTNYIDKKDTTSLPGDTRAERAEFFFPNDRGSWKYLCLDDVSLTFGFSSNREKVYSNITYDGTTEYNRSFERLYMRSHYGEDIYGAASQTSFSQTLNTHSFVTGKNRAVCNSNGTINNSAATNSINNDYYNVWLPGEMYNLSKIASKDGVTVAVGYAVVGSAYQYIHTTSSTDTDYNRTSTALGGIYNDGVLSAMVEGKDSGLVNLLYFKDNESFDYDSYSGKNGYRQYKYKRYGSTTEETGYGTHARDSVQFTAVDLLVEDTRTSVDQKEATLNYYAYYGDSKGRVFRSLVATGTAEIENVEDNEIVHVDPESISTVGFIADTTYAGTVTAPSQMEEIKVKHNNNYYGIDEVYSKIVTIDVKNDIIVITGVPRKDGESVLGINGREVFVIGIKDTTTNEWTFTFKYNGTFSGYVYDSEIIGGYYYIVGDGYIGAVELTTLRHLAESTETNVIPSAPSDGEGNGKVATEKVTIKLKDGSEKKVWPLLWDFVSDKSAIYAIAGRETT